MPTDSETCLFGILPEQISAARPVGVPRLRKAERRQVSLRPLSLEDLLPPDHRARFVWSFAERLDLSALYRAIKAVEGHPGHPPADPRILLALWLYATVEGVGSARELDRLCREQIGFEWLCGGVGVNHTTLAVEGGPISGHLHAMRRCRGRSNFTPSATWRRTRPWPVHGCIGAGCCPRGSPGRTGG
jgi:hypothetical protein